MDLLILPRSLAFLLLLGISIESHTDITNKLLYFFHNWFYLIFWIIMRIEEHLVPIILDFNVDDVSYGFFTVEKIEVASIEVDLIIFSYRE